MSEKTATLIRDMLPGFVGHAALYDLSEPINNHDWRNEDHGYDQCDGTGTCKKESLVIVSTVDHFAHETYIFPGTPGGEIADWGELPGSTKNTTSHEKALGNAGYKIVGYPAYKENRR